MPLWLIYSIAYVLLAGGIGAGAYFFVQIVLPPIHAGNELFFIAGSEVVTLSVALTVFIGILFFVLARVTASPTRKLTRAVDAFADRGEHLAVVIPSFAPLEIKQLIVSFINLLRGVEESQKHEADVAHVRSDFISTAAHQLRTPLTGIRWALEALQTSELTEEQRALIKNASDKSKDLVQIVKTLLDISAIESGKHQYTFAPVDIMQVVEEIAADFKPLAAEREITLACEHTDGLPLVRADRERIKWILNNLVENAIRYTPSPGSVRLAVNASRDTLRVLIRDTGIGIPTNDRGNIFERFYRGKNAAAKENEGNGLGLYIARTIANDHGGDLNFSANESGPGTTFTLSLPIHGPSGA